MAENRVCEIFNSVLKNQLSKHATEHSEKLSRPICKNYKQGSLKKIIIHLDTN